MLWSILLNVVAFFFLLGIVFIAVVFVVSLFRRSDSDSEGDGMAAPVGYSIEIDCRKCNQFNRVPSERLRHRPKCGKCKARLMPKQKVALCRVQPMEGDLRADVNKHWDDEDKFWDALANHVTLRSKDEKGPNLKVVN